MITPGRFKAHLAEVDHQVVETCVDAFAEVAGYACGDRKVEFTDIAYEAHRVVGPVRRRRCPCQRIESSMAGSATEFLPSVKPKLTLPERRDRE